MLAATSSFDCRSSAPWLVQFALVSETNQRKHDATLLCAFLGLWNEFATSCQAVLGIQARLFRSLAHWLRLFHFTVQRHACPIQRFLMCGTHKLAPHRFSTIDTALRITRLWASSTRRTGDAQMFDRSTLYTLKLTLGNSCSEAVTSASGHPTPWPKSQHSSSLLGIQCNCSRFKTLFSHLPTN